jgi:FkbM family methyltransferase
MLVVQNRAVRGRRFRTALIYWRCQIARARGHSLFVVNGKTVLHVPSWSSLGALVAATGTHEYVEERFVEHLLRPDDAVIDVGANIGFYAIPIAASGVSVWAFEPDERSVAVLIENLAQNGVLGHAKVERLALSDFDGIARFTSDLDVMNRLVSDGEQRPGVVEVEVRRLDSIAGSAPFSLERLTLIKVDAEGYDEAVLRGSTAVLRAYQPTVLVETNRGGFTLRGFLCEQGYECYWYDPDARMLLPLPDEWAGNYEFHTNVMAVHARRLGEVEARLRSAPESERLAPTVCLASKG